MSGARRGMLERQGGPSGAPSIASTSPDELAPPFGEEKGLNQSIRAKPWQEEAKTSQACALLENKAPKVVVSCKTCGNAGAVGGGTGPGGVERGSAGLGLIVLCLANPPWVIFRTIAWPVFKNVLFLEKPIVWEPSARCRGGRFGRGAQSCARAELGWMRLREQRRRNRPWGCQPLPREGEATRQRAEPWAGSGTAAGCTGTADSKLVSACPSTSQKRGFSRLGPAPASWVLPEGDVRVVPGLPPLSKPLLRAQPWLPQVCRPVFIDCRPL